MASTGKDWLQFSLIGQGGADLVRSHLSQLTRLYSFVTGSVVHSSSLPSCSDHQPHFSYLSSKVNLIVLERLDLPTASLTRVTWDLCQILPTFLSFEYHLLLACPEC